MEKNKVSVEMIVISQPDPNGTERNELESILVNVWFIVYLRIKEIYLSINGFDWAYFTVFIQRFWLSVWTGILCSFAPEIPHADSELNYTHRTLWANCANDHALFYLFFLIACLWFHYAISVLCLVPYSKRCMQHTEQ